MRALPMTSLIVTIALGATAAASGATAATPPPPTADVAVALSTDANPASAGQTFHYFATGTNLGPNVPATMTISVTLPRTVAFQSVVAGVGGKCTTPVVGRTGTVSCVWAKPPVGGVGTVKVAAVPTQIVALSAAGAVSSSIKDPATANNRITLLSSVIPYAFTFGGRRCTVVGTPADDVLIGTPGDDVICGQGGDDILKGMAGNDFIDAGDGDDLVLGGLGADSIYGRRGDDRLFGGSSNDIIVGGRGDDLIVGAAGRDRMWGGLGYDIAVLRGNDRTSGIERRVR